MTSSSSASRVATVIAVVVVLITGIWVFLTRDWGNNPTMPSGPELLSTGNEVQHENTAGSVQTSESSTSSVADLDTLRSSAQETSDFRVAAGDKFASVPEDRFFTTSDVTDLTPADALQSFQLGQRVYAYAAIHAPVNETVRFTWLDANNREILPSAYLDVEKNTGPIGYRAITYRTFRKSGKYSVRLLNGVGVAIGEVRFEVVDQ